LPDLLRQLGDAIAGRTGMQVSMSVDGHCRVPSDLHVALYRIAQEALNNVVKHSRASQVVVDLTCIPSSSARFGGAPREVELRVSDNGCGFEPGHVPADRFGLGIIRERAQAIGAEVEITTEANQGTAIVVKWKVDQESERVAA
jgi:signal transduction histidine kinase